MRPRVPAVALQVAAGTDIGSTRDPAMDRGARRMTGADLLAEYEWALGLTKPADLDPLRKAGIGEAQLPLSGRHGSRLPLRRTGCVSSQVPTGTVRVHRDGADRESPVAGSCRPGCDGARWRDRRSAGVQRHRSAPLGAAEGRGNLARLCRAAYVGPAPTPVWCSPLRWLGEGCGIVLSSRDRRDQYRVLTCLDSIIAEDEGHADELYRLPAYPWLAPPVSVRGGRAIARNAG